MKRDRKDTRGIEKEVLKELEKETAKKIKTLSKKINKIETEKNYFIFKRSYLINFLQSIAEERRLKE